MNINKHTILKIAVDITKKYINNLNIPLNVTDNLFIKLAQNKEIAKEYINEVNNLFINYINNNNDDDLLNNINELFDSVGKFNTPFIELLNFIIVLYIQDKYKDDIYINNKIKIVFKNINDIVKNIINENKNNNKINFYNALKQKIDDIFSNEQYISTSFADLAISDKQLQPSDDSKQLIEYFKTSILDNNFQNSYIRTMSCLDILSCINELIIDVNTLHANEEEQKYLLEIKSILQKKQQMFKLMLAEEKTFSDLYFVEVDFDISSIIQNYTDANDIINAINNYFIKYFKEYYQYIDEDDSNSSIIQLYRKLMIEKFKKTYLYIYKIISQAQIPSDDKNNILNSIFGNNISIEYFKEKLKLISSVGRNIQDSLIKENDEMDFDEKDIQKEKATIIKKIKPQINTFLLNYINKNIQHNISNIILNNIDTVRINYDYDIEETLVILKEKIINDFQKIIPQLQQYIKILKSPKKTLTDLKDIYNICVREDFDLINDIVIYVICYIYKITVMEKLIESGFLKYKDKNLGEVLELINEVNPSEAFIVSSIERNYERVVDNYLNVPVNMIKDRGINRQNKIEILNELMNELNIPNYNYYILNIFNRFLNILNTILLDKNIEQLPTQANAEDSKELITQIISHLENEIETTHRNYYFQTGTRSQKGTSVQTIISLDEPIAGEDKITLKDIVASTNFTDIDKMIYEKMKEILTYALDPELVVIRIIKHNLMIMDKAKFEDVLSDIKINRKFELLQQLLAKGFEEQILDTDMFTYNLNLLERFKITEKGNIRPATYIELINKLIENLNNNIDYTREVTQLSNQFKEYFSKLQNYDNLYIILEQYKKTTDDSQQKFNDVNLKLLYCDELCTFLMYLYNALKSTNVPIQKQEEILMSIISKHTDYNHIMSYIKECNNELNNVILKLRKNLSGLTEENITTKVNEVLDSIIESQHIENTVDDSQLLQAFEEYKNNSTEDNLIKLMQILNNLNFNLYFNQIQEILNLYHEQIFDILRKDIESGNLRIEFHNLYSLYKIYEDIDKIKTSRVRHTFTNATISDSKIEKASKKAKEINTITSIMVYYNLYKNWYQRYKLPDLLLDYISPILDFELEDGTKINVPLIYRNVNQVQIMTEMNMQELPPIITDWIKYFYKLVAEKAAFYFTITEFTTTDVKFIASNKNKKLLKLAQSNIINNNEDFISIFNNLPNDIKINLQNIIKSWMIGKRTISETDSIPILLIKNIRSALSTKMSESEIQKIINALDKVWKNRINDPRKFSEFLKIIFPSGDFDEAIKEIIEQNKLWLDRSLEDYPLWRPTEKQYEEISKMYKEKLNIDTKKTKEQDKQKGQKEEEEKDKEEKDKEEKDKEEKEEEEQTKQKEKKEKFATPLRQFYAIIVPIILSELQKYKVQKINELSNTENSWQLNWLPLLDYYTNALISAFEQFMAVYYNIHGSILPATTLKMLLNNTTDNIHQQLTKIKQQLEDDIKNIYKHSDYLQYYMPFINYTEQMEHNIAVIKNFINKVPLYEIDFSNPEHMNIINLIAQVLTDIVRYGYQGIYPTQAYIAQSQKTNVTGDVVTQYQPYWRAIEFKEDSSELEEIINKVKETIRDHLINQISMIKKQKEGANITSYLIPGYEQLINTREQPQENIDITSIPEFKDFPSKYITVPKTDKEPKRTRTKSKVTTSTINKLIKLANYYDKTSDINKLYKIYKLINKYVKQM